MYKLSLTWFCHEPS